MQLIKQIASFVLLMVYSVGIAHGAIPHSHYAEMTDGAKCEYGIEQTNACDDGLIHLLINLFSTAEATDIADFFVGSKSLNKGFLDGANVQLAAVLVSFITFSVEETEFVKTRTGFEPNLSYLSGHLSASGRRGPPTIS